MRRGRFGFWRNLRFRLVVLVLVAIVPGLILNLIMAQNFRRSTVEEIVNQAEIVADAISVVQQRRVLDIRDSLENLSREPIIGDFEHGQTAACEAYMDGVMAGTVDFAYVGVLDETGILLCNSLGTAAGSHYSDRSFYQNAVATKGFAVGEFQISRSTGLPVINFAYPILDGNGNVVRVVFAAMLTETIGDFISSIDLPDFSTVTVADEKGTILSRTPPAPDLIGNTELVQPAVSALGDGAVEMYFDGFTRPGQRDFVVLKEIPLVEGVRSGFVFFSVPEAVAFADVNRIIRITNYSLLGFLVAALALATLGLEAAVIRPIRTLIAAANQLSTGDLSSRTGLRHGRDEIGQLANSFDGMASALEFRELEIRQVESRLSQMLANIDEGIVSCSPDGIIRLFNRGAEKMFGYSAEAVMGLSFNSLFEDDLVMGSDGVENAVVPRIGRRADGSTFPVEFSVSRNDDIGVQDFTAIVRDITERVEALNAIERRAYFDIATELPNRTRFVEEVRASIQGMNGDTVPFSIFVAQISDLQSVEDNFGFEFAERLFGAFAERLTSEYGEICTIARLGPDEFAISHPEPAVARNALGFAGEIRQLLEKPFDIDGEPVVVDVQIGIALHPGHGSDGARLVHRASMASHAAESRPDRTMLFDKELEESTLDRVRVLTRTRAALENGELIFHYQPKVDIQKNHVSDVEALLRWDSPEHGLILPGTYIPVVESSGFLWPVTEWGIGAAVEQLYRWGDNGPEGSISVNISARSFRDPRLLSTIESSLELWGVDPGRLDIEITETAVMDDPDQATRICTELRAMGSTISIDDFGVGQSPLAYLDRLPVNTVKIDRAFIVKLGSSKKSDSIVRLIIGLAHELDLTVVAEGVEEKDTVELLRQMGCDEIQGFVFAKPAPADETAAWIKRFNS